MCVCSIETFELIKLVFGTEANFCLFYCHIVLHGNSGIDKTGGTSPGSSYIASSELSRFFSGGGGSPWHVDRRKCCQLSLPDDRRSPYLSQNVLLTYLQHVIYK